MKLRSNRDTEVPANYVAKTTGKTARRANHESVKVSQRKRKRNGSPGKKPRKVSKIEKPTEKTGTDNLPSTSKKPGKVFETHKSRITNYSCTARNKRHITDISELPCHILVKIFELLPIIERVKAERVCRLWNYLGKNFSWSKTENFSYPSLIEQTECTSYRCLNERPVVGNAQVKSLILRCGKYIRCLELDAFRETLSYAVCNSFAPYCPMLRSLNLCAIQLTNTSLQVLGNHCPLLENVNFYKCFQESVVERGLTSFFNHCSNLKSIDLGGNERLTGVPSFSALPPSLVSMKFNGCYRLSIEAMNNLRARCPNIEKLAMSSVDSFSASELNNFFSHLEELRKLKFGECFISHTIGGPDLNLSPLRNLAELTVNDNLLITDSVLRSIGNNCKQLKFFDLSGCNRFVTEEGLLELAKLPFLSYLNLSMLRITTDNVIKSIGERGRLKVLLVHRCDEVSDYGIGVVLKHCKFLTCLDVSFCPKVTDVTMSAMHKFVLEREKREAAEPVLLGDARLRHDGLVSEMLRLEKTFRGVGGTLIDRLLPRTDTLHYRVNQPQGNRCGKKSSWQQNENPEGYTELHVWLVHSGITQPCRSAHRLLKIDDSNSVAEHTPSIFEFRLVIRIH